jgi:hypothetical protein
MADVETQAQFLLHEAAQRRKLVDQLTRKSSWRPVSQVVSSLIIIGLVLLVSAVWAADNEGVRGSLIFLMFGVIVWLSIGLVQVTRQLRALTTIIERAGVVDEFLDRGRKTA